MERALTCSNCGCKSVVPVYFWNNETDRREIDYLECEMCGKRMCIDGDFDDYEFDKCVELEERQEREEIKSGKSRIDKGELRW